MRLKKVYIKVLTILLIVILNSCGANRNFRYMNQVTSYDDRTKFNTLDVKPYTLNDSTVRIFLEIRTALLLYEKPLGKTKFSARYSLRYELCPFEDQKNILDTGLYVYTDTLQYDDRLPVIDSFELIGLKSEKYLLRISFRDIVKKTTSDIAEVIDCSNKNSRQNFLFRDTHNLPVMSQFPIASENLRLQTNSPAPIIYVRCYSRDFPISQLPFVEGKQQTFSFERDSIFTIQMQDGTSGVFSLADNGIFHFQTDTTVREGISLFQFYNGFPEINLAEQMLPPLKYITTKSEFNNLSSQQNVKQAVDNFWLDNAGNPGRARDMIKRFYNRVSDANRYFSSYMEGWKTDRGMLFIVFGPPRMVYRSAFMESWSYGEDRSYQSMTFDFDKVDNPFSDNDYSLRRSIDFKDAWYIAVDVWRN